LNNAGQGPGGAANPSGLVSPPPPGTNTAGTALSSGPGSGAGTSRQTSGDAEINEENKAVDRKIKSICRGC
jgi:hypothetical protein